MRPRKSCCLITRCQCLSLLGQGFMAYHSTLNTLHEALLIQKFSELVAGTFALCIGHNLGANIGCNLTVSSFLLSARYKLVEQFATVKEIGIDIESPRRFVIVDFQPTSDLPIAT
ncbi:uncharacterized protein CC84DRAFT_1175094 [Paraphaeosphaeria sporulosa]|uniref:Uncharacterized protein n=1 Tax=Paraphaeosphaeria sporulosa TaxID=1460663 RepID=A0A177CIV5_9PLEO|nr:uncharacterized protein CC84DRAFT_1175094 [Paraphaeosphaeria sporulosa]OAG07246.1 hypothetical protein CC84DRAFT_1175094 [Paraphaeosphaeria sporulosa]